MFTYLFNKNKRANNASSAFTAADNTTVVPNDTTNTPTDSIDALCLFGMNAEYVKMVEKVFSSMIRRLFIEGIPAKPGEFNNVRNSNCYATVAGKPLDTRKLMDVVGYFGYNPELLDFDFWQKIVSANWENDCNFRDFKIDIRHRSHKSGDTDVYDCTISYYCSSIMISTRTGWSLEFMQRLVRVAGLLILSKLNHSEKFEAYAKKTGDRFSFTGLEYRDFGAMKSNSTTAMKTSAHKCIFNGMPNINIITREKADFSWKLPYDCSVKKEDGQYFKVSLNPDMVQINSYHRRPNIY